MRKLLLALASATSIAVGVGLIYLPAGLITAGTLGFGALYVIGYLEARGVRR